MSKLPVPNIINLTSPQHSNLNHSLNLFIKLFFTAQYYKFVSRGFTANNAFDLNEEKVSVCIIHPLKPHLGQKDLNPRQCKYMIQLPCFLIIKKESSITSPRCKKTKITFGL